MMSDGEQLFARFAFAPNQLGYCGPADAHALFELGVTGRCGESGDIKNIARRFSGAWPYLALLADVTGINNPLDERVVRAYWTGGALLDDVDRTDFGRRLVEFIGSRAGHYWQHLTPALLPEATATHGFHVFGVYPWSRMLGIAPDQARQILDNCRIRWGRVVTVHEDRVVVMSQHLKWDGSALALGPADEETVRWNVDGRGFIGTPTPGERLALHWDWVCDQLSVEQQAELARWTSWQLDATNARLACERADAS